MHKVKPSTLRYFTSADDLAKITYRIQAPCLFNSIGISEEIRRIVQGQIFLVLAGWQLVGYLEISPSLAPKQQQGDNTILEIERYLASLGLVGLVMDDREQGVIEAVIASNQLYIDIYTSWPDDKTLGRLFGTPESSVRSKLWLNPAIKQSILTAAGIVTIVDFDLTPDCWSSEVELLHARQASMLQAGLLMPSDIPTVFDDRDPARSVSQARIALQTFHVAIKSTPSTPELNDDALANQLEEIETRDQGPGALLDPEERHQLVATTVRRLRTTMTWKDAAAALNASGPNYRPTRAHKWTAVNLYARFSS